MDQSNAVQFFWSQHQTMTKIPQHIKSMLLIWDRCSVSHALEFFSPQLHFVDIITTQYAISCFKTSPLFIWNMQTNAYTDEDSTIMDAQIGQTLHELIEEIKANFSESSLRFYQREFKFFDDITKISGILKPLEKAVRKKKCQEELQKIVPEHGAYLPTNPDSIILNIDYTSGIPMQSAAKAPFLARFNVFTCDTDSVERFNINNDIHLSNIMTSDDAVRLKGAIFKVGDDVRQDVLALQLISFFKKVFSKIGMNLFLYPYKVVATSPGCGVIECVERAKSRDQLGKQTDARENFTNSLAAYSVVSFLLQVKDRHNGNIMIDEDGHIIHIDFGFLFESSPGGNINFEPHMKITQEMLDILGGSVESPYFKTFVSQTIKAYLALRPYEKEIVNTVALMLGSNLPCFRGETLRQLKLRLGNIYGEKEAADKFNTNVIQASVLNVRTVLYDLIQKAQNEIPC
ncbi:Phosphatidylinositol 4-kinase alpha [Thelohanellus kitauei]|uniref:1-phosphatidylinositol 4-kinase n=1 Tax=Thelohanellus kitauei TaxID=669202 RepID=A0A0C2NAL9_THEKT|nr:Phosphatidylinositol 4-kinase alpha [Thelohanellus kitauei]